MTSCYWKKLWRHNYQCRQATKTVRGASLRNHRFAHASYSREAINILDQSWRLRGGPTLKRWERHETSEQLTSVALGRCLLRFAGTLLFLSSGVVFLLKVLTAHDWLVKIWRNEWLLALQPMTVVCTRIRAIVPRIKDRQYR